MKRFVSLFTVLVLIVALAVPAFAAKDEFVPSISAKDSPDVVEMTDKDGNKAAGILTNAKGEPVGTLKTEDLKVTAVAKADPESPVAKVYKALEEGTVKMPAKDLVVRDLVQIDLDDATRDLLAEEGVTLDMKFDLKVDAVTKVSVYTYDNDQWNEVEKVKNNGDGTVTVTFEHFCPVMFATNGSTDAPSQTGDAAGNSMMIWGAVLVVSAAAVVALVLVRRRAAK